MTHEVYSRLRLAQTPNDLTPSIVQDGLIRISREDCRDQAAEAIRAARLPRAVWSNQRHDAENKFFYRCFGDSTEVANTLADGLETGRVSKERMFACMSSTSTPARWDQGSPAQRIAICLNKNAPQ